MINIMFDFILFDMIGTTIQDSYNGDSLIIDSFRKAFSLNGFQVSYLEINQQRGKSKKEAITNILTEQKQIHDLDDKIYMDFIALLDKSMTCLREISGAAKVFSLLKENGTKVGLGSGLPMDIMMRIINNAGWKPDSFNYIGSSEDIGKGRPDPAMIYDSLSKLKINDKSRVLKVGDTVADIQEGKNAGVLTAAVLTGTQTRDELEKHDPDYIISDINEIIYISLYPKTANNYTIL
jgi:phosphonatase-like hydrolase